MTDTDVTSLRDDISFLKRLSMEPTARPAPALWLMIVFGGGFGSSALIGYGLCLAVLAGADVKLVGGIAWPFYLSALGFAGATLAFGWRATRPAVAGSPMSRAARAAWTAAFLGLVIMLASFKIFAFTGRHQPYAPGYAEHLLPALLLTLWGAAWWVAGFMGERRWARMIGPASFAAALAAAWQANTVHMLLIAGLSLLLLMVAPAVALLRERESR